MKNKKTKKQNTIFDGIRKMTAPPSQTFKTRKGELARKRKHKKSDLDNV